MKDLYSKNSKGRITYSSIKSPIKTWARDLNREFCKEEPQVFNTHIKYA
jgi:hypothetical protein